jgi:ribose transport system permease protein
MIIIRSLVYGITGGLTVVGYSETFMDFMSIYVFGFIPVQFIVFLIIFIFLSVILNRTVIGKQIYAMGQNEKASVISGILVNKIKYIVYTVNGFLAGVSGLLVVSRTNSLPPRTGDFALIEVITAVVVGGVLMTGGEGSLIGPVMGVLIIYLLRIGFSLLGIDVSYNLIILSLILIIVLGRQQIAAQFSKIKIRKSSKN